MPEWTNGKPHDYFTAEDRATIERLTARIEQYVHVENPYEILLDGVYTLAELRAVVMVLGLIGERQSTCQCGHQHHKVADVSV